MAFAEKERKKRMRKKLKLIAILALTVPAFAYDGKPSKNAAAGQSLAVEEVTLINQGNEITAADDDFASIRRKQYGQQTKQFYYFSRWHQYLDEVAKEKAREKAYERELAEYNKEVKRITAENERIKAYNESLSASEGSAVDVSQLNNENVDDSKKD